MLRKSLDPSAYSLDQRSAQRVQFPISGNILVKDGMYPCRIVNVSLTGLRLHTQARMRPGDSAVLRCDMLDILILTVWQKDALVGAIFDETLNDNVDAQDSKPGLEEIERYRLNRQFFRMVTGALDL